MAIQMRRGQLANYDKSKMLPGEWGISIDNDSDNQKAFISFAPGVSKEVMMVEDAEEQIAVAIAEAIDMTTEEAEAWAHGNSFRVNDYASGDGSTKSFTLAETPSSILGVYVDGSSVSAYTLSGKTITFTTAPASGSNNIRVYYTVNTTTDNAKYYKEQAEAVADSIPEDYSELSDDVDQLKNALKAIEIVDTASGAIASFPDGGDGFPVRDLNVQMEPIQDLHGYDHPWPAGGGKNKLNYDEWKGRLITRGTAVWVNNGVTLTATGNDCYTDFASEKSRVYVTPDSPVTLCWEAGNINGHVYIFAYTSNGTQIQNWNANNETAKKLTITAPSNAAYISFRFGVTTSGATIEYKNIQVLFSSEVTSYEPYSNICPISGRDSVTVTRTGVNIWDEEWEVGSLNPTTGATEADPAKIRSKNFCALIPSANYYMMSDNPASYIWFYDADKNFISFSTNALNRVLSAPSNAHYFKIRIGDSSHPQTTYNHDISINYPSTDTDYHEGHVQTVEIPLGQTVYGGTLDVTQGVLTVNMAITDLGTLNWGYITDFTYPAFRVYGSNAPTGIKENSAMTCTAYKFVGNLASWGAITQEGNCVIGGVTSAKGCVIRDDAYTDAAAFKASVTGQTLAYELAQPVEVQLTPQQITTLLGQNNVWSDASSVSVDYVADTKLYIAKVIADALS